MLFLKTLGGLSVEVDGLPGTGAAHRRKTLALLALLAAAGRRGISRDKLTAYLWPESDSEHARNLLKQASHALRRDLSAPDLFLGAIEVRLNPGVITSDLETFEEALDRGDLARAVAAYTGPFLDGFYLTDAAEFERWVDETRAALKRRVGEALEALAMRAAAHGDTPLAVNSWHRFVELEPLSGKAALGLVRALIAAKERTAALEFGRAHEAIVRRELGIAPDPDLSRLLRQLREEAGEAPVRAAADTGLAPGVVAVAGAWKGRPRPMRLGRRVSVAASLLIIAAAVVIGDSGRVARDPHLLAVAPLEVFDSSLAPWGEGLAHLVSRNLDGVGPFRSLAPGVAIRRSKGYADRAAAERFGRRTGAGLVLFGDLVRVASDSVRLRATVVDRDRDRPVAEFDRLDQVSRIDRLADSLSLAVMRALVPSTSAAYRYLRSPRTASLLALKAFLQGEQQLGRLWLDSAAASYERALTLDSTFALAYSHAGIARTWNLQDAGAAFARAASLNRGLSLRDSLMIAYRANLTGPHDPDFYRLVRRQEDILGELLTRFPEDPEVWHEVGEVQFHLGFFWWDSTWNRARRSFDRAIALDSGFALAYIHAVDIALSDGNPGGALQYVRGYLAIPAVNRAGAGMHLLSLLLDPEHPQRRAFSGELARASLPALRRLALAIRAWPDSAETQVEVARRLVAAEASFRGQPAAYELRFYESLLAGALVFRGHLREARRVVGDRLEMGAFMQLAQLGAMPPETVEAALVRGVHDVGDHAFFPWILEAPCYRTLDAALWWSSRRDTSRLRRLVQREDSLARTLDSVDVAPYAAPMPGFARAALALARGDTGAALRGFLPDSSCPGAQQRRAIQFRLLAALGRDSAAAWVWERLYDRPVPLMLERARVAERLGDRHSAAKYYDWVARAWRSADPELQPRVAEARAALVRLQVGGRR